MGLSQSGLTDLGTGFGPGNTTNFAVWYETTLPNQSTVKANANAFLAIGSNGLPLVENEFNVTTGWFNTPSGKFGTGNRQQIDLDLKAGSGANNSGYPSSINIDSIGGGPNPQEAVKMVWMNEWVEVLMAIAGNWNAGDSSGEGLSQYAGIVRFRVGHYSYYGSWVDGWLNGTGQAWSSNNQKFIPSPNPARSDWVTQTFTGQNVSGDQVNGDGDQISFGCALAFIYYLNVQLAFSINQIISNYNSNLASVYNALTGDHGNPFPFFLNLISSVYPASSTASIPGPVTDNPFPIAIISLGGKNTFGLDEAKDIINQHGGLVNGGVWIEVQGFSKQSFNALKVTANGNFSGSFFSLPGVKITPNPEGPQFQAGVSDTAPQVIMIPFDLTLSAPFLKQTPGSYTLTGSLTFTDNFTNPSSPTVKPVTGGSNSIQFELLAGADPYFTNVDIKQDNQPYLSQDLRVFTATPAQNAVPIVGGPTLTDSIAGGYKYIKDLLNYLNSTTSFTNPSGTDPFTTVFPDQYGANQTDSNVTPFTLDLPSLPLIKLDNNYNFAVARVRMQGSSGKSGEAKGVRVFFRLFATQTSDTDYDSNTTYPSKPDAAGAPGNPLVGTGNSTIPFFATNNFLSQTDYASGGPNIQDIIIPGGQDGVYTYYGCFLNLYDPGNIISGQPVQALLPGTHNCLVAQIAFDDAPIAQGSSPLTGDQMAQRNLQVTLSDNPGPAETHRIPQTFDCRPSGVIVPPGGNQQPVLPDELVIDWGDVPAGSVASLYWPQVNSADVIKLANQFYATNPLTASDSHTIKLSVTSGLSYVPIPSGAGQNFAGLFTVDLPPSKVSTGQSFTILVRRLSSMTYTPPPPIKTPPSTHSMPFRPDEAAKEDKAKSKQAGKGRLVVAHAKDEPPPPTGAFSWRYAVGAFEIKIPVTTGDKMLPQEENTLAIMKWRLQQMLPSNRWYPVLQQYIAYISDRVAGLGGDPNSIPPSVNGAPIKVIGGKEPTVSYTGKVCEIVYDCFGDFEGFILDFCCGEKRKFKSRERSLGELALRACIDRLLLTVVVDKKNEYRICRISICC